MWDIYSDYWTHVIKIRCYLIYVKLGFEINFQNKDQIIWREYQRSVFALTYSAQLVILMNCTFYPCSSFLSIWGHQSKMTVLVTWVIFIMYKEEKQKQCLEKAGRIHIIEVSYHRTSESNPFIKYILPFCRLLNICFQQVSNIIIIFIQ